MRKLTVNKEGMSRLPKRQQQAKRVAPPAVPEIFRHSGSSFGSAGYGSCDDTANMVGGTNFYAANDTNSALNISLLSNTSNTSIDIPDSVGRNLLQSNTTAANISGAASSSSTNQQQSPQTFIYHVQNQQPLTHKAAVYYHQQLALQEDQGIDLTQSPGRDSPGSSGSTGSNSRHSTASLDSGRASSYHTSSSVASKPSNNYQQYSNQLPTFNNSGILSSPRCSSVSSCSIGSADQMLNRSDHEIIVDWLRELSMEEYAPLFSEAGYDMPTICRMTPEDLTAIGIKKPRHRERIKLHIDALQLPDNLPHYIPDSIEEWLHLLRLDEYLQPLLAQGYRQVRDVTQLPWEDMEDIGIVKLGHQKKLLLAIKRIKDILSGKWIASGLANSPQDCMVNPQLMLNWDHQQQYFEQMHLLNAMPSLSPLSSEGKISNQQLYHQTNYQQLHMPHNTILEKDNNDYVLIKLRQPRGRSIDSPDDSDDNRLIVSFTQHHSQGMEAEETMHASGQYKLGQSVHQIHQSWRQYADGDITPTNEMCSRNGREINTLAGDIDRDSLLRHRGMTVPQKNKPIAMVKGNVLHTIPQQPSLQDPLKPCDDNFKKVDEIRSIAPEPPRRHSNSAVRPSSALDQICEDYDLMKLNDQSTKGSFNSTDIYSYTNQVHNQMHSKPYYDSSSCCNQMSMSLPQNQQPIYANYNAVMNAMHSQQTPPKMQMNNPKHIQTRAEVHAEKIPLSNANDSKSNSSIDSIDQLPFANDNAGTIKQRVNQYSNSQMTHSSPNVTLRDMETISKASNSSDQMTNQMSLDQANDSIIDHNNTNEQKPPTIDSNVLNDIGNMLANLTDELDAMLEQEKRAGLNDSE